MDIKTAELFIPFLGTFLTTGDTFSCYLVGVRISPLTFFASFIDGMYRQPDIQTNARIFNKCGILDILVFFYG